MINSKFQGKSYTPEHEHRFTDKGEFCILCYPSQSHQINNGFHFFGGNRSYGKTAHYYEMLNPYSKVARRNPNSYIDVKFKVKC